MTDSTARWIDRALALSAAVLTLSVYVQTIYPGLFSMGDAAKFSFVGKVLGTPHAPGYPLYVMVSHLFSYVPLEGSLAFRMNVLSALLGAVAVFFLYFGARALGSRPAVAAAVALACGLGRAFWAKAQYAKGYTLTAALVCAGVLLLLRWSQTGRRSQFYGAIAVFAISIGNHLIIIALLPALILHALLTNAKLALAPRTLILTVALVTLGFSQYSLILIRTHQQAPYLEASASTFEELVHVVTARRYANEIVAFSAADAIGSRVPIVAGLVLRELTWPGLILALVGVSVLIRRRPRDAVLLAGGAVGVFALTANMSSNEDEGFLLSAFVMLWLLAGVGLEAAWSWRRRGVMTAGVLVLTASIPALQAASNYLPNDHHRRTFEIRYFNALFEFLPDRSAIVLDQYGTNMMVNYKLLGEEAADGRDIRVVPPVPQTIEALHREGYRVFLFRQAQAELATFDFRATPIALKAEPFPEYLEEMRKDFTVVVAATPAAAAGLMSYPAGWEHIGAPADHVFRKAGSPYGSIGVGGAAGGILEAPAGMEANLSLAAGTLIGGTGTAAPVDVRLRADHESATIWINGQEVVSTAGGAVAAVVSPQGTVETFWLDVADGLRVPIDMQPLPLFELTAAGRCLNLGNVGWRDVSLLPIAGRVRVRVDNYRPFPSQATFYVVGDRPAAPTLSDISGSGEPTVVVQSYRTGVAAEATALERALAADQVSLPVDAPAGSYVSRVLVTVDDNGDYNSLVLDFGVQVVGALGRVTVDRDEPRRSIVCGATS